MPVVTPPSLDGLLTMGGLSTFVLALTFVLRKALALTPAAMDRFGSLLAMGVGVVAALVATWALGLTGRVDLVQAVLLGIYAAWASSGLYDTITSQT